MKTQKFHGVLSSHRYLLGWGLAMFAVVCWLLLYKLGSLTGGLSRSEWEVLAAPAGWHGIYRQPFDMPLQAVRSVVFFVFPDHGQTLSRLPNVILGGLAVVAFGSLIRLWHGGRTAVLATALFAFSAWTLHVSRLASSDVVYLWSLPTLILSHFLLRKYYQKPLVWYGGLVVWGLLLYIPGLVWFVLVDIWLQRKPLADGWNYAASWWKRLLYVLLGLVWLPLLAIDLRRSGNLITWLGLPDHLAAVRALAKQFVAVPVHLFVRGPQYPDLWLGKAPILDIFTLVACGLGIYFYLRHWRAARSRYLALLAFIGFILGGLGGPVDLSVLVPLLYVAAATGLAYLLHEWLKIFPTNPLARSLGIGLVVCAVALSCLYNYRAYFIAWPHNPVTTMTFQYRR